MLECVAYLIDMRMSCENPARAIVSGDRYDLRSSLSVFIVVRVDSVFNNVSTHFINIFLYRVNRVSHGIVRFTEGI